MAASGLVREALGDLVDDRHVFDVITGSDVYEVLYNLPGWPCIIQRHVDLMARFNSCGRPVGSGSDPFYAGLTEAAESGAVAGALMRRVTSDESTYEAIIDRNAASKPKRLTSTPKTTAHAAPAA
jgi:hypothetical protein